MGTWLDGDEMRRVLPAERCGADLPVPTRVVSNGEYTPIPQTDKQRRLEARIGELSDANARRLGLPRRAFLRTGAGMATALLAMNEVFGRVFDVTEPEALDAAAARPVDQFVFDGHLHFVRDDFRQDGMLALPRYAAEHGWNADLLRDVGLTVERFKFDNFLKEVYLDSETDIGILSGAPFEDPASWFLSNEQIKRATDSVNLAAGGRRLLGHALFTPGKDGWMDEIARAIEALRPASLKGYTIGDPGGSSPHPWRLDDEALVYPLYERCARAGIRNICIHKGLLPRNYERSLPGVWRYATVDDLPKAAKDWPGLNFVIYHAAFRPFLEDPEPELRRFEETGYIEWVTDLAEIPRRHGVTNVYADLGTSFAMAAVTHPRLAAGMVAQLVKGLGPDNVLWGTDSVWYGSPQWQIEAFRRMEVPEDLRRRFDLPALGAPDGALKSKILGLNSARLYGVDPAQVRGGPIGPDTLARIKQRYRAEGPTPSNRAYGYVAAG